MSADGTLRSRSAVRAVSTVSQDGHRSTPQLPQKVKDSLRERFIPVTRHALMDRLTVAKAWAPGQAVKARRFLRYLAYWRSQQWGARVLEMEQAYEPFSPDSDLLVTRKFTDRERHTMQKRFMSEVEEMLTQANYVRIDPSDIELIMTKESHYGLDFNIELDAFEELLIYYRGASMRKDEKRVAAKFFRKQEFDVPIYRRLFIVFKMKDEGTRVEELRKFLKLTRKEARRMVRRRRAGIPPAVFSGNIFIKSFKDMPRNDLEMVFPNTQVKFRLFDKIKLGVTSGAGAALGVATTAGKLALVATNPIAAAGAAAGLGGVAFRQFMGFLNQRQRYMVVMAQNLYFHSLADNRSALTKLSDRAAEEDSKEEFLLYCVLCKELVHRNDLAAVDTAIEHVLKSSFGIDVDFDLEDALHRLMRDGIVREDNRGYLVTLGPEEAARRIDRLWDSFLDELPDSLPNEGQERTADQPTETPAPTHLVVLQSNSL